jgi:ferredoxin
MEDEQNMDEHDATGEQMVDQGAMDSHEEGFMRGYEQEEEIVECEECGSACPEEKRITVEIQEEKHTFCSETCVQEYKESIAN